MADDFVTEVSTNNEIELNTNSDNNSLSQTFALIWKDINFSIEIKTENYT